MQNHPHECEQALAHLTDPFERVRRKNTGSIDRWGPLNGLRNDRETADLVEFAVMGDPSFRPGFHDDGVRLFKQRSAISHIALKGAVLAFLESPSKFRTPSVHPISNRAWHTPLLTESDPRVAGGQSRSQYGYSSCVGQPQPQSQERGVDGRHDDKTDVPQTRRGESRGIQPDRSP